MKIRFAVVAAATALTALPALAQTTVGVSSSTNITIGGMVSLGLKNSEISNGNAPSTQNGVPNVLYNRTIGSETGVYDNTSRLWILSSSKIAEGWSVFMRIESRMPLNVRPGDALLQNVGGPAGPVAGLPYGPGVNDASGWADGDSWAGVGTPWGNFYAGHMHLWVTDGISVGYLAPSLEHPGEGYRVWDVQSLSTFNLMDTYFVGRQDGTGALSKKNTLGITRSRNVIKWDSLTFKPDSESLLNFSLAWTKNAEGAQMVWASNANGTTYEGGQTIFGKALYNGHGISAMALYLDEKFQGVPAASANTELKGYRLGVSYKANGLKGGVIYDSMEMVNGLTTGAVPVISGNAKRTAIQVPLSYQWGDHGVYATYTMAGKTSSIDNTGAKQMTFAYDYALTKRAFIGINLTTIKNDSRVNYQGFLTGYSPFGTSSLATGEAWRQVGLNLQYWF